MKNLISQLLFSVIILSSQTVFSRDINSKDSIEKINNIKYSVDSLIRSELGNLSVNPGFDFPSHEYAKKYILKEDCEAFNGLHYKNVTRISSKYISIYDLPLSDIIEDIKKSISSQAVKAFNFTKYTVVFGEFKGSSYMVISMDY